MKPRIIKGGGRWGYELNSTTPWRLVAKASYWCKMQNRKEGNL